MDERRNLQGRAKSDSMRQSIMVRRDSIKMQMKQQRAEMMSKRKRLKKSKTLSTQEDMIKRGGLDKAIYYINDKEASKEMIDTLDPTFIKSVTIYKGEKAIKLYGKKGKNGIIQIDTTY